MTLPDIRFRGPSAIHVIRIGKQRTSVRLDGEFWSAFEEIATRENLSIRELCQMVDERRGRHGLTSAIRTFVVSYYRSELARVTGKAPVVRPGVEEGETVQP